jgi:hypothetical protein
MRSAARVQARGIPGSGFRNTKRQRREAKWGILQEKQRLRSKSPMSRRHLQKGAAF